MKLKAASGYACYVKDLNKTAEFYEKLGLQIKTRSADRLIVYLNWYRIDFVAIDKENKGTGIFLYFSVDNVDETYKEILSCDLQPSSEPPRHMNAPRAVVYRALLDAHAIATWKVPNGMTCKVHEFDAREGGSIRISLTYDAPTGTGKTTSHTDTYHGHFVKLVENEQVVEVDEFETTNPTLQGKMTSTFTLTDSDGGTDVVAVQEGLPSGVSTTDNETGWRMSLAKLAALVEAA